MPGFYKHIDPNLCSHAEFLGFSLRANFEVRLNPDAVKGLIKSKSYKSKISCSPFDSDFEYLVKLFKSRKVPVILAVGNSDQFQSHIYNEIAAKEEDRKTFATSVMEIINKFDLDGFMIYWEYPGCSQSVSRVKI